MARAAHQCIKPLKIEIHASSRKEWKGLLVHNYARRSESKTKALLSACGLPTDDSSTGHFEHWCGREDESSGVVGIEMYGSVALLRSLVEAESFRGIGCCQRLITGRDGVDSRFLGTLHLSRRRAATSGATSGRARS